MIDARINLECQDVLNLIIFQGFSAPAHLGLGIRLARPDVFNVCEFLNEIRTVCLTTFCPLTSCCYLQCNTETFLIKSLVL